MYILANFSPHRLSNTGRRVLVLHQDTVVSNLVRSLLSGAGYPTDSCSSYEAAREVLAKGEFKVLVTEQGPSPSSGIDFSIQMREAHPEISVIVLASERALDVVVAALQGGAFDFMTKSFDLSALARYLVDGVRRAFDAQAATVPDLARSGAQPDQRLSDVLIGTGAKIVRAREQARALIGSDVPVLIWGEAGTERLALARAIHALGARGKEGFEAVGVAGTAPTSEVTLTAQWHAAAGGTLYFADLNSLPARSAAELLRLLSTGAVTGYPRPRIISAMSSAESAAPLDPRMLRSFEKVAAARIALPPLRERGNDIIILAEHFAEQARLERNDPQLRITAAALEALLRYPWPENVEELQLAIQHAASLCAHSAIHVADLPPGIAFSLDGSTGEEGAQLQVQSLEDMEYKYILRVLQAVGGNKASAARLLRVDRTTLYRKLQRQDVEGAGVAVEPHDGQAVRRYVPELGK